jgi:hypothetical protein
LTVGRKKGLLVLLLAIVFAWPLCHRVLVAQYGLNPWKYFGFAMYCVPSITPQVRVHVDYGERVERLDVSARHFARLRFELASFVQDRSMWGRLARPDRVGEAVLEVLTRVEGVEVEVIDPFFDLDTAKIAVDRTRYAYPSAAPRS